MTIPINRTFSIAASAMLLLAIVSHRTPIQAEETGIPATVPPVLGQLATVRDAIQANQQKLNECKSEVEAERKTVEQHDPEIKKLNDQILTHQEAIKKLEIRIEERLEQSKSIRNLNTQINELQKKLNVLISEQEQILDALRTMR